MATIPSELITTFINDNPQTFNVQAQRYNIPVGHTAGSVASRISWVAANLIGSPSAGITSTTLNRLKLLPGLYAISIRLAMDLALVADQSLRINIITSNDNETITSVVCTFNSNELASSEFFSGLIQIPLNTGTYLLKNVAVEVLTVVAGGGPITRQLLGTEINFVRLNIY